MHSGEITPNPIVGGSARNIVDFYWLGTVDLQNLLEDIEGADGRLSYLLSLRLRLIELLQQMDGLVAGSAAQRNEHHRLAYALQHGISFLDWSAKVLRARLLFDASLDFSVLQEELTEQVRVVLRQIPGDIPEAQGPQAQRHMLRAMRDWSALASSAGADIGFLAERFRQL